MFMQTIAQTMGPEAISQYINPEEVVKRLAASQGIDTLNLVKTQEQLMQEQQQQFDQERAMSLTNQSAQFAATQARQ